MLGEECCSAVVFFWCFSFSRQQAAIRQALVTRTYECVRQLRSEADTLCAYKHDMKWVRNRKGSAVRMEYGFPIQELLLCVGIRAAPFVA